MKYTMMLMVEWSVVRACDELKQECLLYSRGNSTHRTTYHTQNNICNSDPADMCIASDAIGLSHVECEEGGMRPYWNIDVVYLCSDFFMYKDS
jgi:hypothetical protein